LPVNHLVLVPGLDGTGQLFADFVAALPATIGVSRVAFPPDIFLPYAKLLPVVGAAAPCDSPYVLLAESFSTPLAIEYAATKPPDLRGLILCAGFVRNPMRSASFLVRAFARPWFFRMRPPGFVLKHFLAGAQASPRLIDAIRHALKSVKPEVFSARVHEVVYSDARKALREISIPVMHLGAANDRLVPPASLADILGVKPDILSATIPAPHMLLQREPKKAADLVVGFLKGLAA
jgi:pimeloyl-ACP methyl ester carboxylesterase